MEYKIGQILTSTEEQTIEGVFGTKFTVPKGNQVIIGADKLAHHIRDGKIQPLTDDALVKGHDSDYILAELEERWMRLYQSWSDNSSVNGG